MNRFFLRLPLTIKLVLIGFIPLAFLGYQSAELFNEKKHKLNQLDTYRQEIQQSMKITTLIDNLQLERKFSLNFILQKLSRNEMMAARTSTDSSIAQLERQHGFSLKSFKTYTFVDTITAIRKLIDSSQFTWGEAMHYYSTMIFRLNTLNYVPAEETYLQPVLQDFAAQKLISEMVTYLGIITANVYNVLYTKKYMVETLIGTVGTKQVYDTYLVEFFNKAPSSKIQEFRNLQSRGELSQVTAYLDTVFKTFKFSDKYDYIRWGEVSEAAIDSLRQFQQSILHEVQSKLDTLYEKQLKAVNRTLIAIVLIIVFVCFAIYYSTIAISKSMKRLKLAAIRISRGETNVNLDGLSDDIIGSLAHSIAEIDKNNKELAVSADAIGKGNFNTRIRLRGENDILGNAILQMKTNLKRSTEETEKTKEQFKELADFTPHIVWTATPDGKVEYFNRQWYFFTGFKDSSDLEKVFSILHPEDKNLTAATWKASLRDGSQFKIESRLFDKHSGKYRWFLMRAIPIRDADGNIMKWFGTFTDIDETKTLSAKLESLVEQRTEELNKAYQAINHANINLARSNADLQQFAHITSHDLKEPLRKITIFADQLRRKTVRTLSEEANLYLDKIIASAMRMSNMVEGILKYSAADSVQDKFERVPINPIIKQIEDELELFIKDKNASIVYSDLHEFYGIPVLIHQLFYNLINNSLKFSSETSIPEITITSEIQGNLNCIKVKDNGIGFEQEYADVIFDSFTRLNSRGKYEGTGLGLSLCKKIVLRHNGTITARGEPGIGAEFIVTVPIP